MTKKQKNTLVMALLVVALISLIAILIFAVGAEDGVTVFEGIVLGTALSKLDAIDPLEADANVEIDVFSLKLDHDFKVYRFKVDDEPILAVDYGVGKSYFRGNVTCDENGTITVQRSSENRAIALDKLMGAVVRLYEKGEVECVVKSGRYTYRMNLDEQMMGEIATYILPEAEQYNIEFTSGTVTVAVKDGRVESMSFNVNGDMDVYITKIDAIIRARFVFKHEASNEMLPDAVKNALTMNNQ